MIVGCYTWNKTWTCRLLSVEERTIGKFEKLGDINSNISILNKC